MASLSDLIRDRLGTCSFRRVIPAELQQFMPAPWRGRSAWKRSLPTTDDAAAKRARSVILSKGMADFTAAKRAACRGGLNAGSAPPGETELPPPEEVARHWAATPFAQDEAGGGAYSLVAQPPVRLADVALRPPADRSLPLPRSVALGRAQAQPIATGVGQGGGVEGRGPTRGASWPLRPPQP